MKIRFLPNSAISFSDRHFLIDVMLLFRPIWQKGQGNQITKQLLNLRQIRTGLDFSEDFWINREKNNSLVNGLRFVFLTEPVSWHFILPLRFSYLGLLRMSALMLHPFSHAEQQYLMYLHYCKGRFRVVVSVHINKT